VNSKDHGNHHQDPHELVYYLPGQVILHLTHAADLSPEILTRELAAFLTGKNPNQPWKNELIPARSRIGPDLSNPTGWDCQFIYSNSSGE
jgi:hypothetical protein